MRKLNTGDERGREENISLPLPFIYPFLFPSQKKE